MLDDLDIDLAGEQHWRAACDAGKRVSRSALPDAPREIREALARRPFRDLADPFPPLLDLWATGYVLDRFLKDAVVLLAPEAPSLPG
jgi:hypothetical protein